VIARAEDPPYFGLPTKGAFVVLSANRVEPLALATPL
jgi:hypothetical protein